MNWRHGGNIWPDPFQVRDDYSIAGDSCPRFDSRSNHFPRRSARRGVCTRVYSPHHTWTQFLRPSVCALPPRGCYKCLRRPVSQSIECQCLGPTTLYVTLAPPKWDFEAFRPTLFCSFRLFQGTWEENTFLLCMYSSAYYYIECP
jgi:hypothetical protein